MKIVDLATHPEPNIKACELAEYWNVHVMTIYRDIAKGALKAVRVGSRNLRIPIEHARTYGKPIE